MKPLSSPPLTMWRHLSPSPDPLVCPTPTSPHILVIGGGVTGLVTSWVMLDRGYNVTILSKEWANFSKDGRLTAQIAGALWEYPPAVCGQHTDPISLERSKQWCMVSYHIWDAIASDPELQNDSGVRMMPSDFFFPCPVEEDLVQYEKMKEIMASGARGFVHGPDIINKRNVNPRYGAVDAYEIIAPIIDTDQAMMWLTSLVRAKGATMITETIQGDLLDLEESLRHRFNADAIVNATGLAGSVIAGDTTCYPIRGGLIRVINDGVDFPKVEAALTITAAAIHDANEIVFLVPRNDNILLIGGIVEPHKNVLDLTLDSPIIKRMRNRCEDFLPFLENAKVDSDYPLAQGLRPFRQKDVHVERELRTSPNKAGPSRIVHSYGQGGSGWTLSFGCAADAVRLVEEALEDIRPISTDAQIKLDGQPRLDPLKYLVRARL